MAAIAKFVSYDGGIAFSEQVMKFQKRGQESMIVPLDDVVNIRIRRPQEESEGFIRIETADGRRYRIFFEDDQLQEAVRFKKQFDATVSEQEDDPASTHSPEKLSAGQRGRYDDDTDKRYNERPKRAGRKKRSLIPVVAAAFAIVAIIAAVIVISMKRDHNNNEPTTPPDLSGEWIQTGGNSADSYQTATIQGNTIEVYWVMDSGETTALYWAGSYDPPTAAGEPYKWTSTNDTNKTDFSLMASSDATKEFTYEKGEITYSASALGVTETIYLERKQN